MKKLDESYRHSKRAYRTAMDNGLKPELADSYAMMAKCERNLGINNWGAENYMNAVTIFNELGEFKKIRQARCFAAIAMGKLLGMRVTYDIIICFPHQLKVSSSRTPKPHCLPTKNASAAMFTWKNCSTGSCPVRDSGIMKTSTGPLC